MLARSLLLLPVEQLVRMGTERTMHAARYLSLAASAHRELACVAALVRNYSVLDVSHRAWHRRMSMRTASLFYMASGMASVIVPPHVHSLQVGPAENSFPASVAAVQQGNPQGNESRLSYRALDDALQPADSLWTRNTEIRTDSVAGFLDVVFGMPVHSVDPVVALRIAARERNNPFAMMIASLPVVCDSDVTGVVNAYFMLDEIRDQLVEPVSRLQALLPANMQSTNAPVLAYMVTVEGLFVLSEFSVAGSRFASRDFSGLPHIATVAPPVLEVIFANLSDLAGQTQQWCYCEASSLFAAQAQDCGLEPEAVIRQHGVHMGAEYTAFATPMCIQDIGLLFIVGLPFREAGALTQPKDSTLQPGPETH
jgi:hypothetical protein